nr:hypothetical protein [Streptomyces cinnamoneus]
MPHFAVHEGYAVYEGPATDSSFHMHAAFQVAIAVRGEVLMVDASGTRHQAVALIVPPMVRHRMLAVPHLLTFFVEPQCAFADRLRERCGPGVTADPELRDLREEDVRSATGRPAEGLDGRLLAAMNALADQRVPMPVLSAQVGLSPSASAPWPGSSWACLCRAGASGSGWHGPPRRCAKAGRSPTRRRRRASPTRRTSTGRCARCWGSPRRFCCQGRAVRQRARQGRRAAWAETDPLIDEHVARPDAPFALHAGGSGLAPRGRQRRVAGIDPGDPCPWFGVLEQQGR